MIDEIFPQNAPKFAIFLEYEIPCTITYIFSFRVALIFPLMNALYSMSTMGGKIQKFGISKSFAGVILHEA